MLYVQPWVGSTLYGECIPFSRPERVSQSALLDWPRNYSTYPCIGCIGIRFEYFDDLNYSPRALYMTNLALFTAYDSDCIDYIHRGLYRYAARIAFLFRE